MKRLLGGFRKLDDFMVFSVRRIFGWTNTCGWCGAKWNERCRKGCIGEI